MKKRIILLIVLVVNLAFTVSGQNANLDRVNAYRIAFLTRRLNLTPQEAEKFWPVYNEFQDNKFRIQLERQSIYRNFNQNAQKMTDGEMSAAGDRLVDLEVKEAALSQDFHNKIKRILSPEKVLRLYLAENQFRQQLLDQLQERRGIRNSQEPQQEK
jgi:hypothetical protein